MKEYTVLSIISVVAVVGVEFLWLRTGLFAKAQFWIAYGIIVFFECLVDGWLTKIPETIVVYNPEEFSGWRFPFDIPVEDFLFGFSFIILTFLLWERAGARQAARDASASGSAATPPSPRR